MLEYNIIFIETPCNLNVLRKMKSYEPKQRPVVTAFQSSLAVAALPAGIAAAVVAVLPYRLVLNSDKRKIVCI